MNKRIKLRWLEGMLAILISPITGWSATVDNKTYTNGTVEVHNWNWAVAKINAGEDFDIDFNLENGPYTINGATFVNSVSIDGSNGNHTNILCTDTLFLTNGCTVENMR